MSALSGLRHAAERIHRWPHSRRRIVRPRNRDHLSRRITLELDLISQALLDVYRLPPPASLTPERRAAP